MRAQVRARFRPRAGVFRAQRAVACSFFPAVPRRTVAELRPVLRAVGASHPLPGVPVIHEGTSAPGKPNELAVSSHRSVGDLGFDLRPLLQKRGQELDEIPRLFSIASRASFPVLGRVPMAMTTGFSSQSLGNRPPNERTASRA